MRPRRRPRITLTVRVKFPAGGNPVSRVTVAHRVALQVQHRMGDRPMDKTKPFEVPAEMRKFAEQSVEQARHAFESFISTAQRTMADFEGRAQAARSGAMDVGGRAMSFAERNMAASFEFAQKLVRAKDAEDVIRLQTEYIQSQVQALNEQTKELAEAAAKFAKDAAGTKSL